jgi:hypothetical protein
MFDSKIDQANGALDDEFQMQVNGELLGRFLGLK